MARRPKNQPALDLGEEFAPPEPKPEPEISSAEKLRRHLAAGLCPWATDTGLCPNLAEAFPMIGADQAIACDETEPEHGFVGNGDLMCRQHAGDVADSWWWEMWDDPWWEGWQTDSHATLWYNPAVWVELHVTPERQT